MTDRTRESAATAGSLLFAAVVLCAAIGAGIGLLAGSLPLPTIAGVFVGFALGFKLVYTRFKNV